MALRWGFTGSDPISSLVIQKTKEDKLWGPPERRYQDSDNEDFFSPIPNGNVLENEARRIYSAINECEVKVPGLVE